MCSVRDNLAAGKYENKVPYAVDKVPVDENTMTVVAARAHQEAERQRARVQRAAWRDGELAMMNLLRVDLESEHGTVGNPKAERLWELAWEGRGYGFSDVISRYEELAELVVL